MLLYVNVEAVDEKGAEARHTKNRLVAAFYCKKYHGLSDRLIDRMHSYYLYMDR